MPEQNDRDVAGNDAPEDGTQPTQYGGWSCWATWVVVILLVAIGVLLWRISGLTTQRHTLESDLSQAQADAMRLQADVSRLQAGMALAAEELLPLAEEHARVAQAQAAVGNTQGAEASLARAKRFLEMARGIVPGDAATRVEQIEALILGAEEVLSPEAPGEETADEAPADEGAEVEGEAATEPGTEDEVP